MKKVISIILLCAMILSLCACSQGAASYTDETPEAFGQRVLEVLLAQKDVDKVVEMTMNAGNGTNTNSYYSTMLLSLGSTTEFGEISFVEIHTSTPTDSELEELSDTYGKKVLDVTGYIYSVATKDTKTGATGSARFLVGIIETEDGLYLGSVLRMGS